MIVASVEFVDVRTFNVGDGLMALETPWEATGSYDAKSAHLFPVPATIFLTCSAARSQLVVPVLVELSICQVAGQNRRCQTDARTCQNLPGSQGWKHQM